MVADDVWGARGEATGGTAVLESSARWSEEGARGHRSQVRLSTGSEMHTFVCLLYAQHLRERKIGSRQKLHSWHSATTCLLEWSCCLNKHKGQAAASDTAGNEL